MQNTPFQQGRTAYDRRTITVNTGTVFTVSAYCRQITILDVSGGTLSISIDNETPMVVTGGIQIAAEEGRVFNTVTFTATGSAATVTFAFSSGLLTDNRFNVAGNLNVQNVTGGALRTTSGSSVSNATAISVTTTNTALVAANSVRRRLWLQSVDTNTVDVWVQGGATATTANGIQLKPGQTMILESGGQMSAITASGTANVRIMTELD